ncbi:helix-turn-helix transcriptional regulator [Mycobacterium sp. NPDC048908]|uniref:AraC family transcriptional regulator n=1 Tax=Mycobacterium sp. NPDC048908 TaxID=3364292 RepID=UPI003718B197
MISIGLAAADLRQPECSQVEVSDPADVEDFLEDAYGAKLRLRRPPGGDLREGPLLKFARTSVGPFTIDDLYLAGELEAAPDPLDHVVAIWATAGRVSGTCDGMTAEAGPGDIALLSQPDLPHRSRASDLKVTSLMLDQAVVAGVATGLPSSQAPLPVRFSSFQPVDETAKRLFKHTVDYVKRCVLVDDATATPLVLGHASRLLAAVTLSTFPNTLAGGPMRPDRTDSRPVILRRAMEYIDSNATNDIGVADIAAAVHVTPRAVQYMFRRHLETTPLQYLRRLRLHYAHQDLVAADRMQTTVTDIAARWGFAHTGRFAVIYRQVYGQSPHTTLRG